MIDNTQTTFINCLACDNVFEDNDLDFIYPATRDLKYWNASCPCCSIFVTGTSKEDALEKWFTIDQDYIKSFFEGEE